MMDDSVAGFIRMFGRPPSLLELMSFKEAVASVELSRDPEGQTYVVPEEYKGWVWSGWTAHPVEHITHDREFMQPVCGARLSLERLRYAERPTGLAPECSRCKRKEEAGNAQ